MGEKKEPHVQLTEKNNGSSSTQEVLYADEYKKADKTAKQRADEQNNQN
ncbi:MAG TPA: YfhE family protein [Pseudobacillus sp.]